MPISLTPFSSGTLCFGNKWQISNQLILEEIVAKVLLGRVDHAQKILNGLGIPKSNRNINNAIDDAIKKLTYSNEPQRYHRDGLVFQIFSWVASSKTLTSNSIITDPHLILAHKGFDGVQIDISLDGNKIEKVRIFEDKATENQRKTIQQDVFSEFKKLNEGNRESELDNCVITLLKNNSSKINDLDTAIESLIWEDTRRFKISITINPSQDNLNSINSLFKDYDNVIPGDIDYRQSEYISFTNLRDWMDDFCNNVISILKNKKV